MALPRCFFDIAINGVPTGRIIFELFSDVAPKTSENFRCLCTGEKGEGKTTFKPLHYKGTPIHRIVKGFIVQGGDFSNGDGTGGESIYGGMFEDESFKFKHDRPFLLSMANKGPNTNGSQFFITTCPTPHLDGIHVVFGQVVDGKQYVKEMENQKVDANHRPYADVRITNTGELVLMKRGKIVKPKKIKTGSDDESESSESSTESSLSSSSSEADKEGEEKSKKRKKGKKKEKPRKEQKKKHKKKKKKSKKKVKKDVKSSSEEASGSEADTASSKGEDAQAPPKGDLPEDIKDNKKSWLYRYSKSPSPKDPEKPKVVKPVVELKQRDNELSQSGRKLKGRGTMQYRTPPPSVASHRADVANGGRWDRRPWEWSRKGRPDPSQQSRWRDRSRDRSRGHSRKRSRDNSREGSRDRSRGHSRKRSRDNSRQGSRDRSRGHSRKRSRDNSKEGSRDRSRSGSSDGRRRSKREQRGPHRQSRSRDREQSRERSRKRSKRSHSSESKHSRPRSVDRDADRKKRDEGRRSHRDSSRSPRRRTSGRSKSPADTRYSKWARHGDTSGTSSEEERGGTGEEKDKENAADLRQLPPAGVEPSAGTGDEKREGTDLMTGVA